MKMRLRPHHQSNAASFHELSPRKAATVLCNMTGFSGSEALLAKLGKYTSGKGCLYIKKLADVDQKVLEALVLKSVAAMRARYPS
jgi:hypothetical protein